MTRFARAKGSKSSNEKKPEEATSWAEMKKAMQTKPSKPPDERPVKVQLKSDEPKQTTWASLGGSGSLLKPDFEEKVVEKKKKKAKTIESDNPEKSNKKKRKMEDESKVDEGPAKKKKTVGRTDWNNAEMKKFGPKENYGKRFERNYMRGKYEKRNEVIDEIIVNGVKVPIVKFQGFPVTQEDAERLKKLKAQMIKEGVPKDKLEVALKLERRRAEKALQRLKKAVCFHCRGSGHLLSNCPMLKDNQDTSTGICYKCGSTEHSAFECKVVKGTNFQFAECFICKEQGHIARQCPDNPRGLYPQGGACRECGDVTHLRKDCPKVLDQKTEETVTVGIRNDRNLECLDEEIAKREMQKQVPMKKKIKVKF